METSRVALITGATSGLGGAVTGTLAARAMHVLVHVRDRKLLAPCDIDEYAHGPPSMGFPTVMDIDRMSER